MRRLGTTHARAASTSAPDGGDDDCGRKSWRMRRFGARDAVVGVIGVVIGGMAGFCIGRARRRREARSDDAAAANDASDATKDSTDIDTVRKALRDAEHNARVADARREYAERELSLSRSAPAAAAPPSRVVESAPTTPQKKRARPNNWEHVELPLTTWAHKPRLVVNEPSSLAVFARAGQTVWRSRACRPDIDDVHADIDDDDVAVPITRRYMSRSVPPSPSKTPLE
mmetsp:Transcript_4501/g.14883  ORF Transcript_4501/g.14883 Transcript_4501/m.14883 type:complete len:228 (-) Transcript_4501:69-752(-)